MLQPGLEHNRHPQTYAAACILMPRPLFMFIHLYSHVSNAHIYDTTEKKTNKTCMDAFSNGSFHLVLTGEFLFLLYLFVSFCLSFKACEA